MAKQMPKKIYFYCGDYAIVCLSNCCSMQMFQPYLPCKLYSCTYQPRCLEHGSTYLTRHFALLPQNDDVACSVPVVTVQTVASCNISRSHSPPAAVRSSNNYEPSWLLAAVCV